mmetsp:Transcript_12115/g.22093  ORF Transcript_12115/g.22093 Transcript_12115/m.22093 type:complete len:350 (-) Transcript_12115:326-1375(-)
MAAGEICGRKSLLAFLQPMYVLLFTGTCYAIFLVFELLPRIESIHSYIGPDLWGYSAYESEVVFTAVSFHFFLLMFLVSFRLAAFRSPGRIPMQTANDLNLWRDGLFQINTETEETIKRIVSTLGMKLTDDLRDLVRSMIVVERKKRFGFHRFCSFCTLYKPDRTHHCRICGKCTLRMDHHCPWLANCVGYGNYKYFLLTVFYALCLSASMVIQMAPTFVHIMQGLHDNLALLPVVLIYACVFMLTPLLLFFMGFHIYLTANAMTTIEYREKKNSEDPYVQRRFQVAHLKFDQGYMENLKDSLGPVWSWLIPYFDGKNGCYTFSKSMSTCASTQKIEGEGMLLGGKQGV